MLVCAYLSNTREVMPTDTLLGSFQIMSKDKQHRLVAQKMSQMGQMKHPIAIAFNKGQSTRPYNIRGSALSSGTRKTSGDNVAKPTSL